MVSCGSLSFKVATINQYLLIPAVLCSLFFYASLRSLINHYQIFPTKSPWLNVLQCTIKALMRRNVRFVVFVAVEANSMSFHCSSSPMSAGKSLLYVQ
jgi:hypothetical protein